MPTKAELNREIYLLLAAIHLNGFIMSPEMARKIFDQWCPVFGQRPDNAQAIIDDFNTILQQRVQTQTSTPSKTQRPVKSLVRDKNTDSPFILARGKKRTMTPRMPEPKSSDPRCKIQTFGDAFMIPRTVENKDSYFVDLTSVAEDDSIDETRSKKPKME